MTRLTAPRLLPDGHQALLVDGGGIDGGEGALFANCDDDVHVDGMLAPIVDGIGCVVSRPDGSRHLARGDRLRPYQRPPQAGGTACGRSSLLPSV